MLPMWDSEKISTHSFAFTFPGGVVLLNGDVNILILVTQ